MSQNSKINIPRRHLVHQVKIIRLADILENQPLAFDDGLIRQMLQCVVVQSKDCIKVIFNDGTEIDQPLQ